MNRFLVFAYADHDPYGGLGDVFSSFNTLGEAIACAQARTADNVCVFDCDQRLVVWERDTDPLTGL